MLPSKKPQIHAHWWFLNYFGKVLPFPLRGPIHSVDSTKLLAVYSSIDGICLLEDVDRHEVKDFGFVGS